MARVLQAVTEYDVVQREKTALAADVSAGSNVSLSVENNDGFTANDYVVIGIEGSEKAELQQVASVSGSGTITVSTLKFAHKAGTPVTKYRYNQRKFYGATSATGSFTELTDDGSPKDIQVDDPQGTLLEYTGGEGYTHFKATYYNATTEDETDADDATTTEADESLRYTSIYKIRKQAGMVDNPYYSDADVEARRKQAENEVNSAIFSRYTLPLSEVPFLIENICTLLAAGYIDYEEFREDGEGKKWLGQARGMLKSIKKGEQVLLASDGTELTRVTRSNTLRSYPDSTLDDSTTEGRKFKVSNKF
jgi:phage gp36-like protein